MNRLILEHFGLQAKGAYAGMPFKTILTDIKNAISDNQMIAICGAAGSGKTVLFHQAVRQINRLEKQTKFIYVCNFFKERLTIANIVNAMIYDLSNENLRRDFEARSRQVIRLLGRAHVMHKINIVIIIEEAHRIHANTFRALKELRECSFNSICPLFSIVLIGHPQLSNKLEQRKEVFWRSRVIELNEANGWMTFRERVRYIKDVWGESITARAREDIAVLTSVPLQTDVFIEEKLTEAYKAGKTVLDEECVEVPLLDLYRALDVSLKQVAEEAGTGKTTVYDVLHGNNTTRKPAVKKALESLARKTKMREVV
jgi:type II secretory pathway predicted ATPase ExeA/predicted DNA-binding protein YlxM (UPF0122 family)